MNAKGQKVKVGGCDLIHSVAASSPFGAAHKTLPGAIVNVRLSSRRSQAPAFMLGLSKD
jgi:hypothetical protein